MPRTKSRYYELATPVQGPEREFTLRYWNRPYLESMTLVRGLGFIREEHRLTSLQRFTAAVAEFGTAFDGGSLTYLTSSIRTRADNAVFVDSSQSWFPRGVQHYYLADHSTFFRRPGEPVTAIVWQPYDYDDDNDGEPLREFCGANHLTFEVSEEKSWHFPGASTALIFTREATRRSYTTGRWLN
jgi:hypothetical protein